MTVVTLVENINPAIANVSTIRIANDWGVTVRMQAIALYHPFVKDYMITW